MARWHAAQRGLDWEIDIDQCNYHSSLGPEWDVKRGEKPQHLEAFDTIELTGKIVSSADAPSNHAEILIFAEEIDLKKVWSQPPTIGHMQDRNDRMHFAVWVHDRMFLALTSYGSAGRLVRARLRTDLIEKNFAKVRSISVSTSRPEVEN